MSEQNSQNTDEMGIYIDFNDVIAKSEQMEALAKEMGEKGVKLMDEWYSFNAWRGEAASDYKRKIFWLSCNVLLEANRLKLMAENLKAAAERLKAAEDMANNIFGIHQGGR